MKIGILAVQGAFAEHKAKLEKLGAQCIELRKREDLDGGFDGLVLPGGESTVQGKLLRELDMFQPMKEKIEVGMPVLATCAGLILLADQEMKGMGEVPMTFIRAPYIEKCEEGAEVLAEVEGNIVAVKYKEQYGLAFHPELDEDDTIHSAFLESVKKYKGLK